MKSRRASKQEIITNEKMLDNEKSAEVEMSRAEWLAPSEEAVTSRTPDPLVEHTQ
jgi:hypothetical protein